MQNCLSFDVYRGEPMPSLNIFLETDSVTKSVLKFASAPVRLIEEIRREHEGLEAGNQGLPRVVWARGQLKLTFPKIAGSLQDWIRYEVSRDGDITDVGNRAEGGSHFPPGRSAKTEQARSFSNGSIVLLLESPHTDEMKGGQPAAGSTGRNIESFRRRLTRLFQPMLNELCVGATWEKIPLVIANPCPYPASCLANLEDWAPFRDFVFSRMFPLVAQDFTCRRLTKYRPLIILNACTGGNEAGMIIRETTGAWEIIEGVETTSPKALVNDCIRTWLGTRCFERQYLKNKRGQQAFVPDEKKQTERCPGRTLEGYWVDVGHPASWKNRDQPATTDGSS